MSLAGSQLLSAWLGATATLRVLRLQHVTASDRADEEPLAVMSGLLGCMKALTRLVELQVQVAMFSGSVHAFAELLPHLQELTRLKFGLPNNKAELNGALASEVKELVVALRSVPKLAELTLVNVDPEGAQGGRLSQGESPGMTVLQGSFSKLPGLTDGMDVRLACCMGEVEHAQLRKLEECLPWQAQMVVTIAA